MLATLLTFLALAPAPTAPAVVVPYEIEGPPEFRATVQQTLADPRGWALGGSVELRPVAAGGRFVVRLAAPATVASYAPCSEWYSCRSGPNVLINAMRWTEGADSYAGRLAEYRVHVINHEVGHALGLDHQFCAGTGAPAAVMQQQSKGLMGCTASPWPLAQERRALGQMLGVRPRAAQRPDTSARRLAAFLRWFG